MKAKLYLAYPTRSLWRNGARTLLAIICIAVGVMAIVSLQLASEMVTASITGDARALTGGDLRLNTTQIRVQPQDLPVFDQMVKDNRITGYTPIFSEQGFFHRSSGRPAPLSVARVEPNRFPLVGDYKLEAPTQGNFATILGQPNTVVIAHQLAQNLNLSVGSPVSITSVTPAIAATVGGILDANDATTGADVYVALPPLAQRATTQRYSNVYMTTAGSDATKKASDYLKKRFPLDNVTTADDTLKSNQANVTLTRRILEIVGLIALLIGGAGIVNTMNVLLSRRRTEIAMLKTAGYRRGNLYLLFGIEAGLLGLLGGILGAAAGVGIGYVAQGFISRLIGVTVPFHLNWNDVAGGLAVGIFTALIFGILPIVRGSAVRPLAVLRDLPEGTTFGTVLVLAGLLVLLSVLFTVLASVILGDAIWGAATVYGAVVILGALSFLMLLIILIVSFLPVPEKYSPWYLIIVTIMTLLMAGFTYLSPGIGIFPLIVAIMGYLIVIMPKGWKINLKMSLRNLGRQRGRSVMTMVAMFVGVFSIALVLVLTQNLRDKIDQAIGTTLSFNVLAEVPITQTATYNGIVATLPGLRTHRETIGSVMIPVAIKGTPIADVIASAPKSFSLTDPNSGIPGDISTLR